MNPHPAAGKRILVTRAAPDAARWATRLAALGATPVVLPCLMCQPIEDDITSHTFRAMVLGADWLLLSSSRGAEAAARLLRGAALPVALRVAAVGPATAASASNLLGRVDLIARVATSRGLACELIETLQREGAIDKARVVVAGPVGGRDDAVVVLEAAGVRVDRIAVYRTVPAPATANKRDLAAEGIEVVLLASPSAVTGLLGRASLSRAVQVVTIGPTTSAAATAAGLVIAGEAVRPTFESILEAIV